MSIKNMYIGLVVLIALIIGVVSFNLISPTAGSNSLAGALASSPTITPSLVATPSPISTPVSTASPTNTPDPSNLPEYKDEFANSLPAPSIYPEATLEEQQAFAESVKEEPIPTKWGDGKDVLFRLNSDPRLMNNSLMVSIPKRDETITIFFKKPMDRSSVEKAIKKIDERSYRFYPKLLLHWSNDQELHVKALISQAETKLNGSDQLSIDLKDARTQSGGALKISGSSVRNSFVGTIAEPLNLWKVALDQPTNRKQLTSFDIPYNEISLLDTEARYFLLARDTKYGCRCDTGPTNHYSVYDTSLDKYTYYPYGTEIMENYRGSGSFVADRRGFFYEIPDESEVQIPMSKTAMMFKLPEFVHGAAFSKDKKTIILVTGSEKTDENTKFNFRLIDVATSKETLLLKQEIIGGIQQSYSTDERYPIKLFDDSQEVYFEMQNPKGEMSNGELNDMVRYRFNWQSKKLAKWDSPGPKNVWLSLKASDDGRFKVYANGGLYDGNKLLVSSESKPSLDYGVWIPQTHDYAMIEYEDNQGSLVILHAGTLQETIYENIKGSPVGTSKDGKWIYVLN